MTNTKPEKLKVSDCRDKYQYKSKVMWQLYDREPEEEKVKTRCINYFKEIPLSHETTIYKEIPSLPCKPQYYNVEIGTEKLMRMLKERMLTGKGDLRKNMLDLPDYMVYAFTSLLEEAKESRRLGKRLTYITISEMQMLNEKNKRG